MRCWHGWHSCGPWPDGPSWGGWYSPPDWEAEPDWPVRRRYRRSRRLDREEAGEELEARLQDLRDEIRRVEAELVSLRRAGESAERS